VRAYDVVSWARKKAVYEKSYDEVLLALKHQDDKLNRTLTAIAFLTAAGVAIYAIVAKDAEVRFDESDLDATTVFFVVFLVSVLLALLVALSAIGPSDSLPPPEREPAKEKFPSLLFWARIVKDPDWETRIDQKDADWLEQCLARNFHQEARVIARRVRYKVARSRESGAFVQLAVLSLVLLGIFSAKSLGDHARWSIAGVVLTIVLALPLWDFRQMRKYEFPQAGAARGSYALVGWIVLWAALLFAGADRFDIQWWAVFYSLAAILATRLAYVHRSLSRILLPLAALAGPVVPLLAWVF
jgi:hypothetical protein